MKHIRILLIVAFVLVLTSAFAVFAQDASPIVNYAYNGSELQKFENGVVVRTVTMPNGLETQQLVALLNAQAQDASPMVTYAYNGSELQKFEDGAVVRSVTMPNGLETQQLVTLLNTKAESDRVHYVFDNDRMYHMRGNEVVALWLLRGGNWVDEPVFVVQYDYNGQEIQRFVNGRIQQVWTLTTT